MKPITICYCGNKKIFGGIFMSVLSIMKNTDAPLDIILLSMDLSDKNPAFLPFSEEQRMLMERTLCEKNPLSRVRIIDVTEQQTEFFEKGKNNKNYYTPYASIRLFLDMLDVPDKIIYLDADIMCLSDISELYDTDIEEYEFGAALDIVGHKLLHPRYCNSGVLLLNMKKIRETGLFERARVRVRDKWMMMPDQTALNMEAKAKLILPYRFNEQRKIKPDTVLKHFCKGYKWHTPISYNIKQWQRDKVHKNLKIHDFDDIYELYDKILADGNEELIKI